VLEGKGHPTLTSVSYRLAAIETLSTLISLITKETWNGAAFRGLHGWAYRSAIDGSLQPYSLYVPKTYDSTKSYSLIVALHGFTSDPVSSMKTLAIKRLQPEDFIVAAPFARGDMGYLSIAEQDVLDVIENTQSRFHIDPDRIYLMGWSMGGLGTWRIGQYFADKFAAIAPFAGWTGTQYLENLRNLPVFAVHGDADRSVSVRYDREAAQYLQTLNYSIHYEELPGGSHDAWGDWIRQKSGGEERLLEYFRTQRRNPWPEEVVLKTNYIRYGQQYWVRLIELANPPYNGLIRAKFVNPSQLVVSTQSVTMFALNFDHPQLSRTSPVIVEIDGSRLEIRPQQGEVFFQRGQENQWVNVVDDRLEMAPHHGGGFADIMVRPMLIVYGTRQRGEILKKAAELFADWSPTPQVRIGCKAGQFRVKADTDITEADLQRYHLLLFGGPEENVITQRIAEKLPVQITATGVTVNGQEFQQAGLSLTYPNPLAPQKLIGILMLPFPDAEIIAAMPYMGLQFFAYQVAQRATEPAVFPDVLVFNSLSFNRQTVLWIGWFDHTWQNLRGAGT
jgi:poly(3-hydroxybutyrate) depolymerase